MGRSSRRRRRRSAPWSAEDLTPLINEGNLPAVRTLLTTQDVPLNFRDEGNWTPLMVACYIGNEEIIMFLLSQPGCDVNASDYGGTTAFMNVAKSGNLRAVKLMLAAPGIDIHKKDDQGKDARSYAKRSGLRDVYKLVDDSLAEGAKPSEIVRRSLSRGATRVRNSLSSATRSVGYGVRNLAPNREDLPDRKDLAEFSFEVGVHAVAAAVYSAVSCD